MTDISVAPIDEFRSAFQGKLVGAGDDGYEDARQVMLIGEAAR